jgi:hypothetical protein
MNAREFFALLFLALDVEYYHGFLALVGGHLRFYDQHILKY